MLTSIYGSHQADGYGQKESTELCKSTNIVQESQTDVCAIKIVSLHKLTSSMEQVVHTCIQDIVDTSGVLVRKSLIIKVLNKIAKIRFKLQ